MPKSVRPKIKVRWEEFTAPDFARAVKKAKGVCILPVSVIEKHGDHLPLGTDLFAGIEVACRAAALEPAIVFPPYYFGHIPEARHVPGTIAIDSRLMIDLLENLCDEIARNGLKKIVILSAHGGNRFLGHFTKSVLDRERDYAVYLIDLPHYSHKEDPRWTRVMETPFDAHGGEGETSWIMAIRPDLVKKAKGNQGQPLQRLAHLPSLYTAIDWYANYPTHYAGDARPATIEKGETILQIKAEKVAARLKAIKKDRMVPRLLKEFYARAKRPLRS